MNQDLNKVFEHWSILLAERGVYAHARVWLGSNKMVHVKIEKNKSFSGKIFQFDTFKNFIGKSKLIEREKIEKRAELMTNEVLYYDLNCEHLAFQCARAFGLQVKCCVHCQKDFVLKYEN